MKFKNLFSSLLFLAVVSLTVTALAFPFWLEAPKRDNKRDPKSPDWIEPTSTMVPPPVFSPTPTPSLDGFDPGDGTVSGPFDTATVGGTTGSHFIGAAGDNLDIFTVMLTAGRDYDISVNMTGGSSITVGILGTTPALPPSPSPSQSGTGPTVTVNYSGVPSTTTYYISVQGSGTVQYTLTIADVTGALPTATSTLTATPTATPSITNTMVVPPTATPTATPTTGAPAGFPCATCIGFEDFELGATLGSYTYADGTVPGNAETGPVITSAPGPVYEGTYSEEWTVTTVAPGWGAGGGHAGSTTYGDANGVVDVSGAQRLRFWVYTDQPINFFVSIKEYNVFPGPDATNEQWLSSAMDVTVTNSWQMVEVDLSTMAEGQWNGDCCADACGGAACPNGCSCSGNNTMDLNVIGNIDWQFTSSPALTDAKVYIDAIEFDTTGPPVPTPTNTPTITMTYTPVMGPAGLWYDGETAGATGADLNLFAMPAGEAGIADVTTASSGQGGTTNYVSITYGATAYYSAGALAKAAPVDASGYTDLDFWFYVPSSTGNCFNGGVQLISNAAAPNDQSRPVTITPYVVGGGPIVADTWHHVVIPLSAFTDVSNHNGGMLASASLASLTEIRFMPYYREYDPTGAYSGEVWVDTIGFSNAGIPEVSFGNLFADMETQNVTQWDTYWSWYYDANGTCSTNATVPSFPHPTDQTVPPFDATDGHNSCRSARIAGFLGDGTPGCPSWSFAGMGAALVWDDSSCGSPPCGMDLGAAGIGTTGLHFSMKKGPGDIGGQQYNVVIMKKSVTPNAGFDYYHGVTSAELTTTWQDFYIDFPPVGVITVHPTTLFGQPSWMGAAEQRVWNTSDIYQIAISAVNINVDYDVFVDNIWFY